MRAPSGYGAARRSRTDGRPVSPAPRFCQDPFDQIDLRHVTPSQAASSWPSGSPIRLLLWPLPDGRASPTRGERRYPREQLTHPAQGDPAPGRGQDRSPTASGSGVPAAGCDGAVMAAIMSSSIRICPQPDVPGGRGRHHRAGARDGPARPAGLRRRLGHVASFVRWYEEPALARQFDAQYEAYRRGVPAWRPRNPATEVELVTRQWQARQNDYSEAPLTAASRSWAGAQIGGSARVIRDLPPLMVTGLEVADVSEDRSVAGGSGQDLFNPNYQHARLPCL